MLRQRQDRGGAAEDERHSAADLAAYLEALFASHGMPTIRGLLCVGRAAASDPAAPAAYAMGPSMPSDDARLVALAVFRSAALREGGHRAPPPWFQTIDAALAIVADALGQSGA